MGILCGEYVGALLTGRRDCGSFLRTRRMEPSANAATRRPFLPHLWCRDSQLVPLDQSEPHAVNVHICAARWESGHPPDVVHSCLRSASCVVGVVRVRVRRQWTSIFGCDSR